jgi:hypothetical protein
MSFRTDQCGVTLRQCSNSERERIERMSLLDLLGESEPVDANQYRCSPDLVEVSRLVVRESRRLWLLSQGAVHRSRSLRRRPGRMQLVNVRH